MSSTRPLPRRTSPSSTTATPRTTTFRLERLSGRQGGDEWDRFRRVREDLFLSYAMTRIRTLRAPIHMRRPCRYINPPHVVENAASDITLSEAHLMHNSYVQYKSLAPQHHANHEDRERGSSLGRRILKIADTSVLDGVYPMTYRKADPLG